MRKNKTTLTLLLILCLFAIAIFNDRRALASTSRSTLIVPSDFESIQDAINKANPGDIIRVRPGIYYENIVINKSITLIGENRENTIIDGGGLGNVISVQAPNVNISGFTIRNSNPVTGFGIYVERFGGIVISNNNIRSNNVGIHILFSNRNQIRENMISVNNIGVQLIYSSSNVICKNDIRNNYCGIDIYYSVENMIYENVLFGNIWGVYLYLGSNNNVFYHNNFIDNVRNVYAEHQTINAWSFNGEGNYWSDYESIDKHHGPCQNIIGSDGIGDYPYDIAEGNIDYYPLMGTYKTFVVSFSGNIHSIAIISNSTILNLVFRTMAETKARVILFNASISSGSAGFSRVVIPKALMEYVHAVFVNEEEVNATLINVEILENICLYIEHFGNCTIKIVYSELLYSILLELNARFLEFNISVNILIDKLKMMNVTLYNLLKNYSELQDALSHTSLLYQNQTQNLRSLIYIFATTTTIFILTTIYFSKKAHERVTNQTAMRNNPRIENI